MFIGQLIQRMNVTSVRCCCRDVDAGSDVAGDFVPQPVAKAPAPATVKKPEPHDSIVGDPPSAAPIVGCDGDGHPDSILGVKLHRVPGRNKSGRKYHRRLRVVCPFPPGL